MTTVDLSTTTVVAMCNHYDTGTPGPKFCASLRFDSQVIRLLGSLDQIESALEQLDHDIANLRSQSEQDEAAKNIDRFVPAEGIVEVAS